MQASEDEKWHAWRGRRNQDSDFLEVAKVLENDLAADFLE